MNIDSHIEALRPLQTRGRMLSALAGLPTPLAAKSEISTQIERLTTLLAQKQRPEALATGLSVVRADPAKVISRLRREGVLRASRYEYRAGALRELVESLIEAAASLQLAAPEQAYLRSCLALFQLAAAAERIQIDIRQRLAQRPFAIKTVLAILNQYFAHARDFDPAASPLTTDFYTSEELAEAGSSLLALFLKGRPLTPSDLSDVDVNALDRYDTSYERLLTDAARLNELRRAELLIDGLPYHAKILSPQHVHVDSIDPLLEMSFRMGHISFRNQLALRDRAVPAGQETEAGPPSFVAMLATAYGQGLHRLITLVGAPNERLVLRLADVPALVDPLKTDGLFREDIVALLQFGIDSFDPEALKIVPVSGTLTTLDLLKVSRLFTFISHLYQAKLEETEEEAARERLALRSVVPVFSAEHMLLVLRCVLPPDKAEETLKLLSLGAARRFVDLQYTPFVQVGPGYMVAPALVAASNIARNVVCANALHARLKPEVDPMQRAVAEALRHAGFLVAESMTILIAGVKRETDLFAWRDNVLFILECKRAFHPCTVQETRNSFDLIDKARQQLDIRLDWYADPTHQATLFQALNWGVPRGAAVHTGIIIGNRVFNGWRNGRHPVRQAHELLNVLRHGTIGSGGVQYRFWRSDVFQTEDLIDYFEPHSIAEQPLEVLTPYTRVIPFRDRILSFQSYAMDAEAHTASILARYPRVP